MQSVFEKKFDIRTGDCDCMGNILPSALLDLFQSVAGEHANILNCGFDNLIQKDLIWVMTKIRYSVIKSPEMYQSVIVKTWPLPAGKIILQREYLITDLKGNVLVKAEADWVTVHSRLRKIQPPVDVYPLKEDEFCIEQNFSDKMKRISTFETSGEGVATLPGYCDTDFNRHVNNTKYANFVLNAFPLKEGEKITDLQIDYHKEIKSGEKIFLFSQREENNLFVMGKSADGTLLFTAKLTEVLS